MSESLLSSALDDLEQRIKSAKSVDIVFHPSVSDLRLRYLVENSKPTRTLDEMLSDNQTELRKNIQVDDNKEESTDVVSEEFKISFREVLRLAKSGSETFLRRGEHEIVLTSLLVDVRVQLEHIRRLKLPQHNPRTLRQFMRTTNTNDPAQPPPPSQFRDNKHKLFS